MARRIFAKMELTIGIGNDVFLRCDKAIVGKDTVIVVGPYMQLQKLIVVQWIREEKGAVETVCSRILCIDPLQTAGARYWVVGDTAALPCDSVHRTGLHDRVRS